MKTFAFYSYLIAMSIMLMLNSCKDKITPQPVDESKFQSLEIPPGFTWSTLNKTNFTVNITHNNGELSQELNGFPLDATDMQGNRLMRCNIINGQASFYLELNKSITEIMLLAPSIEKTKIITMGEETYHFPVSNINLTKDYQDSDNDGVYDDFDDFPDDPEIAFTIQYPSPYQKGFKSTDGNFTIWYYQVFEDLWPSKGDYDFNDLTLKIKMVVNTNGSGKWQNGTFDVYIWTNGATIDLGCGIDFFKYNGMIGDKSEHEYLPDGTISLVGGTYNPSFTSMDATTENGIIVFENADDVKPVDYLNTGYGATYNPMLTPVSFSWNAQIPRQMRAFMYLFYSNDRSHEIRTVGLPPTEGLNTALLHTASDNSPVTAWNWNPGTTFLVPLDPPYFVTNQLHPWGIEIEWDGNLQVAFEKVNVMDAFPEFKVWAESGGQSNQQWYQNPSSNPALVFDVDALVTP